MTDYHFTLMESTPQNLREALETAFSLEELRTICFDLQIEYENFLPQKGDVVRELIKILHRENRLIELIEICEKKRKQISWYRLMEEYIRDNKPNRITVSSKEAGYILGILVLFLLILVALSVSFTVIAIVFFVGVIIIVSLLEGD